MIKDQIDGFKVIVKIATYIIVSFHMIDFLENDKYILYHVTKTTYILNNCANHLGLILNEKIDTSNKLLYAHLIATLVKKCSGVKLQ